MHANVISEREQNIAVRRGGDINAVSNRSEHNTHTKRYGHKPARHKDHNNTKSNMANHRSLKRICSKLKYEKPAKSNPLHIVVPKKTAKEFPKQYLQPTWENAFQTYMNLHAGSTKQAERTPKNTILYATLTNRNPAERFETALIDHVIKAHPKNTSTRRSSFAA